MYKPRLKAPTTTNKHWIHTSKGGYNSCILISGKSCLPNCVGYAWGRAYELMGKAPKLSRGNAEMWYGTKDGYERGETPRLGAVICWRKGKVGKSADGAGHVAVVERVNPDGSILISESGYNAFRFRTRTLEPPYAIGGAYVFQGFIYNPAVEERTYRTLGDMNLRTEPSLKSKAKGIVRKGSYLTGIEVKDGWLKLSENVGYVRVKGQKVYCEKV